MTRMKAKVIQVVAPGKLDVVEREIPQLHPEDLLVKIDMSGVCGTDIHEVYHPQPYSGSQRRYPAFIGHEPVGTIVEMGPNAPKTDSDGMPIGVGDRIIYVGIGRTGKRHIPSIGGAYAEYAYVGGDYTIYKVKESIPVETAVLAEPFENSLRIMGRAFQPGVPYSLNCMGPGKIVVIQGSGCLGILEVAVAKLCGAYKVVVIGAPENRLDMCRKFGADLVINFQKTTEVDRADIIKSLTPRGVGPDVVLEIAGAPEAFREAINLVCRGGTVVEAGHFTYRGTIEINPEILIRKDMQIFGHGAFSTNDFRNALRIFEAYADMFPFDKVVTHKFPLEQAMDAINLSREGGCVKAVIVP
jgi:L-iditol 2-dehydrogenase